MKPFIALTGAGLLALAIALPASAQRVGTDELAQWVEVTNVNTYEPGYGSVVTVATLESRTDRLLRNVRVALVVRDGDGGELGRTGAQVALLAPGGWAPFKVVFKADEYPGWAGVEPLVWRAQSHPGAMAPSLEVVVDREDANPPSSYVHEVHGTLTSTDDQALAWTGVDAAFFDADGNLVAVGHDSAATELPPGASADFSIGTNTAGGEIADTRVRGYARPVER